MLNRRRSETLTNSGFVEKKNCLRCYRLHKKCDGSTPSCARCTKAKTACTYTYSTADGHKSAPVPEVSELQQSVLTLQKYVEQQKHAFKTLEERFELLEREKKGLEIVNMKLSQALMNSDLVLENQLSTTTQLQDLLLSYYNTGYFFMRVNPLVTEASQYLQEKVLGSNPLKTAAMDLIFCTVFILAGKADKGMDYIQNAKSILLANNTNNPLGLLCAHLMAKNHLFMGQNKEAMAWWQRLRQLFSSITPAHMPQRAKHVENQIKILSQVMDVEYAQHTSSNWLQWSPEHTASKKRVDQYAYQVKTAKLFANSMMHNVNNCCGMASFLGLKLWSELMIVIEHAIDTKGTPAMITQEGLLSSYNRLIDFCSIVTDPRLLLHISCTVGVSKLFIAIVTANYGVMEQIIIDILNSGCLDQLSPNPLDAPHLFVLLQLLYYLRSPFFAKVHNQFEVWAGKFPVINLYFKKWIQLTTSELSYPVELSSMEDYLVVLPHLYFMQMHNVSLSLNLPIFPNSSDIGSIDALLLSTFDDADTKDFGSSSSPSEHSLQTLDLPQSIDFSSDEFEFDNLVNNA